MADPKPLSLGQDYYPPESRRRHEEGVCVVKITVTAQGDIEDPTLTLSTGTPLSMRRVSPDLEGST
jgi:outer membrane biosynthesis protein TonB